MIIFMEVEKGFHKISPHLKRNKTENLNFIGMKEILNNLYL